MDSKLQRAAESGSIDELYALIDENPYILDNIDAIPFVNTPLHIAAASGKLSFAMEMLNLKPSFATKLNPQGYSPLHMAVKKRRRGFVYWLIGHNPSLACVKGREGITPFLLLVVRGDVLRVTQCLTMFPECIKDVSVNGENALHLAVINDKFEVLQVLTGWIQRTSHSDALSMESTVLNKTNYNFNTALHVAASKNNLQAVKLLLECREVKRNKKNGEGLTATDILRNQGHDTGGESDLEQTALKTGSKKATAISKSKKMSDFLKSPITFRSHLFTVTRRMRSHTPVEARGVFLILCALLITSAYQTALQPHGGLHQSSGTKAGTVMMKPIVFFVLWCSNTLVFSWALFYTFCFLPLDNLLEAWFCCIGVFLGVSYAVAMAVISPYPLFFLFATFAFFLFCLLILPLSFTSFGRSYNKDSI